MKIIKKTAITLLVLAGLFGIFFVGAHIGTLAERDYVYGRCMKYYGYQGYPMDGYCKLFVGAIKARDE